MTRDGLHLHHQRTHTSTDMTVGNISSLIIGFTLPLLAGNIFQQLYNTVDSIVVGNYIGKEALAAIGSTTSLVNTVVGFFAGLATGGGVIVSQYFGAHEIGKVRKTVHTMIAGTLILGVLLTFVGIAISPFMLRVMSTPADVFAGADLYLQIYFVGLIALMCYNTGSGILRAVGDSHRPLIFLIISSLLNVALDIIFVVYFKWGIAGAAYATIISEAVSAVLVFITLVRSSECYRLALKELKIDKVLLRQIVNVGFPSGLQLAITAFSNVFVQGYINRFGSSFMAGWASYSKIDQFAMLPVQTVALAMTTFVGQNYGAQKMRRVKEGVWTTLIISFIIVIVIITPLMIFARPLVGLFNRESDVLYYGVFFIRICSPFYIFMAINNVEASALRGLGNSTAPMAIMLFSFVAFRQIYLFVVTHLTDSFYPVSVAYPVGWFVCSIILSIYYRRYMSRFDFNEKSKNQMTS